MSDLVKALLGELETELKQQQLWAAAPPDAAALASTLPFCYDTMPLENWLQFIYINKLGDDKDNVPGCAMFSAGMQTGCGDTRITGNTLSMRGTLQANGQVVWDCGIDGDTIDTRFRPASCR